MTTTPTGDATRGRRLSGEGAVADRVRAQLQELYARHVGADAEGVVSYYPPGGRSTPRDLRALGLPRRAAPGSASATAQERFPLHSISKVFTYALALEDNGRAATLARIGVEPSGDPFNSITFDEVNHRPHNPMVNAGALVATSLVRGADPAEKVGRLLERLRVFSANPDLDVDPAILEQQLRSNDRNLGVSYLMRALGMLEGDIEENIAVYLSVCSVTVTPTSSRSWAPPWPTGGRTH